MALKILIIDDEAGAIAEARAAIERHGQADFIEASTLIEAMAAVAAHPDIDAVVVDGCFPHHAGGEPYPERGHPCSGQKFICWFRNSHKGFVGHIIAGSSSSVLNKAMMDSGATLVAAKGGATTAFSKLFAPKPAS